MDRTVLSQTQALVPSATQKRVSTFDDMPASKVMRHASGGHFCPPISDFNGDGKVKVNAPYSSREFRLGAHLPI